jgi:hypothetical protein
MKLINLACATAAGLVALVFGGTASAGIVVGHAGNSGITCRPFCIGGPTFLYDQVYDASAFSGAIDISSVSFFLSSPLESGASYPSPRTYDVSFYLTDKSPGGLTTDPTQNHGALLADWGDINVGGVPLLHRLTFSGPAFSYDPSQGNLLIEIETVSTNGAYYLYYRTDNSGSLMSSAWGDQADGLILHYPTVGLVTGFNDLPEPGAWALMILGLGGVGAMARRRRSLAIG